MPVETPTRDEGRLTAEPSSVVAEPAPGNRRRALAIEQIHRVRRLKLHLSLFALGIPILGGLWVLTEYYEEHTWPSRFASAPDVAGTWDPWFFFVAGIWSIALAIHALRTYVGPPVGPIGRHIRRPSRRRRSIVKSSGSRPVGHTRPHAGGTSGETLTDIPVPLALRAEEGIADEVCRDDERVFVTVAKTR